MDQEAHQTIHEVVAPFVLEMVRIVSYYHIFARSPQSRLCEARLW